MARVMSFNDRQQFVQALAVCRNLAILCRIGEPRDSMLKLECKKLVGSIDETMHELIGDAAFDYVRNASAL